MFSDSGSLPPPPPPLCRLIKTALKTATEFPNFPSSFLLPSTAASLRLSSSTSALARPSLFLASATAALSSAAARRFCVTLFLMRLAREANWSVLCVSPAAAASGASVAMTLHSAFPPREFLRKKVSLLFLYPT